DDLVWMTARASKIAQIGCDCFAQVGVATARRILQQMSSLLGKHFCSESFPNFYGKFVERRESGDKRDAGRSCDPEIKLFSNACIRKISHTVRKASRTFYFRFRFRLIRAQERFGQRVCKERHGSNSGPKISFPM